ncbi:MAG: hypothetical protein HYS17_00605 [Micavibrio aeruginosavorus]|uniref:asparagine synthase (glutamine-hydrolyzing) n=1 Tax=Micavibrio aeruginosavorus TaxID=349221 RepID=A0A7T5R2K3_9BACT|nr:MAG: hypothetical protein HYS17_00605 [Micavibrio aeruginosavorus]
MHTPDFPIQHFTISVPRNTIFHDVRLEAGAFAANPDDAVVISARGMETISYLYRHPNTSLYAFILGSPIVGELVNREDAARLLVLTGDRTRFIQSLNGEFLAVLVDPENRCVDIYTDRFSSYPFFWAASQDRVYGSYNYTVLAQACRSWPGFALRPAKAYEFFKLQRLMGDETHDNLSRCLPSAGHLHISGKNEPRVSRYWRQDYSKTHRPLADLAPEFSSLIKSAIQKRRDVKNRDTGIFLSGGHDSRIVACHMGPDSTCYTLGFRDNFEVECARRISNTLGQKHVFIDLPEDYFVQALNTATYLSGGLYANDHALFIPQGRPISYTRVLLHGHGLDYMFQGMYLHAGPLTVLGRPTYIKTPEPLPQDISRHFIDNISFRLKFLFEDDYGVPDQVRRCRQEIYENVKIVENQGREITDDPSSLWEYLIFHQPSRHYTFTNVLSKRLCGEVRTPSFDNHVYDFYMALPDKYRLHADITRAALYDANRLVAEIPAGNHGLPAAWGPYRKTAALIGRKLLRHLTGNRKYYAPSDFDRTWPDRTAYMKRHESYRAAAMAPLQDQAFRDFLTFIDWKRLETQPESLLDQEFGGAFWVSMLSYYRFYKFVYAG